jgi:hypothetical protein
MKLIIKIFAFIVISLIILENKCVLYTEAGFEFDSLKIVTVDSAKIFENEFSEGKKLYRVKCKRCHELYKPKDYKLETWVDNLDEMKVKAELDEREYKLILGYLSVNCKK